MKNIVLMFDRSSGFPFKPFFSEKPLFLFLFSIYLKKTIYKNGHIHPEKYCGWYCISDENFLTEQEIKEIVSAKGEKMLVSAESGHPVQWTEEDNYVFKLSRFQEDLKNWLVKDGKRMYELYVFDYDCSRRKFGEAEEIPQDAVGLDR